MSMFQSSIDFAVIGLGRFGYALAETLAANGKDVIVLDNNENKIRQIQNLVQEAYVITEPDLETLEEAGIRNCETVIVCIGEHVEISILTTLHVIELGVPRVISKAVSSDHGKILEKIGAEVVYPERDRAIRLAETLTRPRALDTIDLSEAYAISEIQMSSRVEGKSIRDLDLRRRFNLNIIALVRGEQTIVELDPELRMLARDVLAVVGRKENTLRFEQYLSLRE